MFPLHDPSLERDACGVGFVADLTARPRRDVVTHGLTALARLAHRGGSAVLGTIDGCGLLTAIPWRLLARDGAAPRSRRGTLGLGMFFLPADAADLRTEIARRLRAVHVTLESWRRVPADTAALGAAPRGGAPDIWQAIVSASPGVHLDRALYVARLSIERAAAQVPGLAVVSLSSTTVVYKALVEPSALAQFYPDLAAAEFESPFAVFHQRFSTNTSADWSLAQPFRLIAHNGEINTIAGNRLWMRARLADRSSTPALDGAPIDAAGSDSQTLDTALDYLRAAGFTLPHAISRLLPPAWERDRAMPDEVRAFFEFQALASESWEGPAALVFCDGRHVGAALDRNGFRPARVVRTADGLLTVASEVGVLDLPQDAIVDRGRLGPGEMLAFDLARRTVIGGTELQRLLARTQPYRRLVNAAVSRQPIVAAGAAPPPDLAAIGRRQVAFGYTREEIDVLLKPMMTDAHEAVGSMGDDAPPAALSGQDRLFTDFFRQKFAQVTNPPIDPYREALVMSLVMRLGAHGSYVDEAAPLPPRVVVNSPVLGQAQLEALTHTTRLRSVAVDATFRAAEGAAGLARRLDEIAAEACAAAEDGASLLVLSDRAVGPDRAPVPALLATSTAHHALIAAGLRMRASLAVETGEVRDAHGLATLVAYGAAAVCPYLAYETIRTVDGATASAALPSARYQLALQRGFVRILSKMGVCTATAYLGAQLFDTLGLDRAFVARYFPGTSAPLGGIGLPEVAAMVLARHAQAFGTVAAPLEYPGLHGYRRNGEYHANNPAVVRQLHRTRSGSVEAYTAFAALVHERPPAALRDLLVFKSGRAGRLDAVEPVDAICRRFFASAMSVGALAPEAHRAIAIAMNRLGARSNSGEGGEEPERYVQPSHGDWTGTRTKQIASARFGVTPAYLRSGDEIQIKIAQGSKPGEGGQLPGEKVVRHIARLRHAQPGTALISPPVHHDIYSIEDLAQLIFDLKALHPRARINVKLVSGSGVGIIAAGVVKAGADAIQISGHDGGTGASPRSSIKHAGLPWEIGLAEAHQVLVKNGLRDRVLLQTDGGLKTGRDIAIAAALGAEEYGFGTAALVAIGCVMARQCHLNTCPVGIATQRPELRARFDGTPEMLVEYLRMVAGDVRRILAALGLRSVDELVGRVDLVEQRQVGGRAGRLDLAPLLVRAPWTRKPGRPRGPAVARPTRVPVDAIGPIGNADRTVGASVAGAIAAQSGDRGLPDGSVRMAFVGSAGQSFGAFALPGMELHLTGDANDYVGKGMHGGDIVVRSDARERGRTNQVLVGNTALYGATGGRLFVSGHAGERFAVRNSGATAVVEGVGDHACEYMTGGTVVVLGPIGRNFAAGMSGGVAYVLAPDARLAARCNPDMVSIAPVDAADRRVIRSLLAAHRDATGSRVARRLLRSGDEALAAFRKIAPAEAARAVPEPEAAAI